MRVLYVDGDPTRRVERRLSGARADLEVATVERAGAAIERLADGGVDCVVSRQRLPDGDGLGLLEEVRERDPTMPFVLYVADGSEALASDAVSRDVTEYVPADRGDLAEAVESAVDRRSPTDLPIDVEWLYRLVENTNDIVWLATPDMSELLYVNRAYEDRWGYDRDRLYDDILDYMDHLHPDYRDRERELLDRMAEWAETGDAPEAFTEEFRIYDANGELRWVRETTFPIRDEGGRVRRWAGVVTDVTERTERERALREKNERLEAVRDAISHDLRNPLNVARGGLELAESRGSPEDFERVRGALDRMEALLDDLLRMAEHGREVTETEAVGVATVAERAWSTVSTGDATLHIEGDRTVRADPARLRELFENLFRNAVEHGSAGSRASPDGAGGPRTGDRSGALDDGAAEDGAAEDGAAEDGAADGSGADPGAGLASGGTRAGSDGRDGRVTVTVGATGRGFYVADDGPGVPESERERVFESGYSTSPDGTGFGLAIVREIAEAHGWEVEVGESEAGGARFAVATGDPD